MSNLRDIKRRIKSVRNTSQITKAMQMVASAKMRRAQELALRGRTYMSALANVLHHLGESLIMRGGTALMEEREDGRDLIIVVNTDKGLCGALNANLLREVVANAPADAYYLCIGNKLAGSLQRLGREVEGSFSLSDSPTEAELKPIFDIIRKGFDERRYARVRVAYQKFVNVMVQRPQIVKLVPVEPQELLSVAEQGGMPDTDDDDDFLLEPSPEALLESVQRLYVSSMLVQLVLEGKASEQSARMVAMKSATENAKTLIDSLTLDYNKARQSQITNELLEITTAMKAME